MLIKIFYAVMSEPSIAPIIAYIDGFLGQWAMVVPFVLIALFITIGLFGRRMTNVIRYILFFVLGFFASVYWLVPLAQIYVPELPGYVVGLVIGIIASVLSRFIYDAVYISFIGFDVFNICYGALVFVEVTAYTKGNLILSLVIAAVFVIVALVIRKYLEMLVTALIGGIGVAYTVYELFDFTKFIGLDSMTTIVFAGVLVAAGFMVVQYNTRIKY